MRNARAVLTPWLKRKDMISRTDFCSSHAALIASRRIRPMPSTVCRRAERFSITSKTSLPNFATSFCA